MQSCFFSWWQWQQFNSIIVWISQLHCNNPLKTIESVWNEKVEYQNFHRCLRDSSTWGSGCDPRSHDEASLELLACLECSCSNRSASRTRVGQWRWCAGLRKILETRKIENYSFCFFKYFEMIIWMFFLRVARASFTEFIAIFIRDGKFMSTFLLIFHKSSLLILPNCSVKQSLNEFFWCLQTSQNAYIIFMIFHQNFSTQKRLHRETT